VIPRLLAAVALIAGCRHEPTPAPPPHARGAPAGADPAPAPPTAGAGPVHGGLTGEMVLGEDELGLIPNLRLGTVTASAGIDLTAVMDRLRAVLPSLRLCLRSDTMPRPKGELTLTLSFAIDREGRVGHANLRGTEILPLRQCLAFSLMGKKGFPPGPAEVEASLIVSPVRPSGGGARR
jgi:hypothetical protein